MKQKTRKTAVKRVKKTSSNKLLRGHAYSSHLKKGKRKSRLRRQKEPAEFSKAFQKKFKRMIGI